MQTDSYLSTCTKLKDFNINPDILNLIEEKWRDSWELIGTRKDFLNRTMLAQAIRPTISKWLLMKLRGFCKVKNTSFRQKYSLKNWRKIFTNYIHLIDTSIQNI